MLKQRRIRRLGAETVLGTLREPAIKVADGVAEAASIHLRCCSLACASYGRPKVNSRSSTGALARPKPPRETVFDGGTC